MNDPEKTLKGGGYRAPSAVWVQNQIVRHQSKYPDAYRIYQDLRQVDRYKLCIQIARVMRQVDELEVWDAIDLLQTLGMYWVMRGYTRDTILDAVSRSGDGTAWYLES